MEIRRVEEHIVIKNKKSKNMMRDKRQNSSLKNRLKSFNLSPKLSQKDVSPKGRNDELEHNPLSFSGLLPHKCEVTQAELSKLRDQIDDITDELSGINLGSISSKVSQKDMESIVLRLRRHFQKEMETLRDQNVIFHRQVNQKIEAQMVEKNDFYNEISDFVRYDEFHVFQNRLNMIEQQMQNRSVSISESDPSAESSEQEDEQLDEVGEILPNEAPPEDQEKYESEESRSEKTAQEAEISQKGETREQDIKSTEKIVALKNDQISDSSPIKPTIVQTLKIDKLLLNNTDGSLSGENSARDIRAEMSKNNSVKNKKKSENSSTSTKLHKIDYPVYDHTEEKEEQSNNSHVSTKFYNSVKGFNLKIEPSAKGSQRGNPPSMKKRSNSKIAGNTSKNISDSSVLTRSKRGTRSKLNNRMTTGFSGAERFYNQRSLQITDQLDSKIKKVISGYVNLEQRVIENKEVLSEHTEHLKKNDEIIEILMKKVGYFETKGFLHFKKHYLGPLHDLESLKRKYTKRMDAIETDFKSFSESLNSLKVKISKMATTLSPRSPGKDPKAGQKQVLNIQGLAKERTLTDIQIHQGFLKCEAEIDKFTQKSMKTAASYDAQFKEVKEEIDQLKGPLENLLQDLVKEKESMGRQMDREISEFQGFPQEVGPVPNECYKTTGCFSFEGNLPKGMQDLRIPNFNRNGTKPSSVRIKGGALKRYNIQDMKRFVKKH